MASFSHSTEPHRLFIDRYFEELLARGIQYFLPSSELTIVGRSEEGKPELRSHLRDGGADLEWLGAKYSLVNQGKDFTEHEQKLLKGIGKVLSTRYQLLFNAEVVARSSEIFNGLPEDHYVSGFLDPYVFAGAATLAKVTDRVSEAIDVLTNQRTEHLRRPQNLDGRTAVRISAGCLPRTAFAACGSLTLFERVDVDSKLSSNLRRIAHGSIGGSGRSDG